MSRAGVLGQRRTAGLNHILRTLTENIVFGMGTVADSSPASAQLGRVVRCRAGSLAAASGLCGSHCSSNKHTSLALMSD